MGVVVVAAGSGTRLGADRPKAFVEMGAKMVTVMSDANLLRAATRQALQIIRG